MALVDTIRMINKATPSGMKKYKADFVNVFSINKTIELDIFV